MDTSTSELAPAKILVVDDEHLVALDLQQRLRRMGHSPVVVYSSEQAIENATSAHFDLVLMDIKLKGAVDGIDAAGTIRSKVDVPIIYVTAYADNHTVERARKTEPYGYVLKPFDERELKAAIEIALVRHDSDIRRREQEQLLKFLADASVRLAESLDYRTVARGAADLIVPRYADWCLIHLKPSDDTTPSFKYSRPDGDAGTERIFGDGPLLEAVERDGQLEMRRDITETELLSGELGIEPPAWLHELGTCSLLCMPLVARNQVLGALALISGQSRPRYGGEDVAFVGDLCQRLAMALDNALLYRKAERAIRIRDDVLAIVSHDLRTPLGTVLMQAEALGEQPELRKFAGAIARSAHRMNRLIGDLLDVSAINAGQLTLDIRTHCAADLVREIADVFRSQASTRGIALAETFPDDSVKVRCDRDRVLQVLSNLISNALEFTPKDGAIDVSAERRGSHVRFEVRDTGRGIAPDEIPHLFDRFWRGHARREGAGLGLYIAKGIVAAHGGMLEVASELGVGSRFFFSLPGATG